MKSMIMLAVLGAAAAAPPAGRPGLTLGTDSMFVDFNGRSGGFKFFLQNNNNTDGRRFWNMAYHSLQELDVNGTVVQRVRPVLLDLTLTSGTTIVNNTDGTTTTSTWVNAYQPLNNGVVGSNIIVRHEIFSSPANFTRGNITIIGTANRLKISANITGWAFQANTNQLALNLKINDNFGGNDGPSNGGRVPIPGGGSAHPGPRGRNLAAGNNNIPRTMTRLGCPPSPGGPFSGVIDLEDFVYLDGAAEPTAITINQQGNMYQLVFPYFAETAFYDPEVYTTTDVNPNPNGAATGLVAGVVGLAGVAAAAFLAL